MKAEYKKKSNKLCKSVLSSYDTIDKHIKTPLYHNLGFKDIRVPYTREKIIFTQRISVRRRKFSLR